MPDFLLVHEAGHGAWAWAYVRAALEDGIRRQAHYYHQLYTPGTILTPDLPGHGTRRGKDNLEACTFDRAVDDLLAQTERAQLRAPTVVGHGLTALLALEVARRLKSRPRNVILLAGAVPSFVASPTEAMPLIARLTWWAHLMRPGTPSGAIRLHREAALRIFCKGMSYPEAGMHVLGKLGPIPIHMLDALPHPGVYSLGIPITYVALKQDGVMPYKTQRQAAGQLNALWTELDASHEAPITHAHAVADILLGKVKAEPLPRPEAAAA